jgi:legumain
MKWVVAGSVMFASAEAAHWAVIMAGSNTYGNYRHQADACHAYQIAKRNGIPESNIIMLAYDDIANDSKNPFPGKVFNKPTSAGVEGVDVYAGCNINYRGKDVTGENFLKVLSGDASASGPVLKSTAEDHVFVYYADHGGTGILGVPNGAAGGYIHAADINAAIETLQKKGGYKDLLFYLEACESGSIFNTLLKAPNAKAVTAASPTEPSWGWYCPSSNGGDKVNGKEVGSCLGDEFSVRWMEDTESTNVLNETVGQQFAKVKKAVTKSHVQKYGVTSFDSDPIGDFEGNVGQLVAASATVPGNDGNGVSSREVELHQAYYRVNRANTAAARKQAEDELSAVLARRHSADVKFGAIASFAMQSDATKAQEMLEGSAEALTKVACHKTALESSVQHCGSFNDYSLRYSRLFVNLCESGLNEQAVVAAIEKSCGATDDAEWGCSGSGDPVAATCYEGSAGALGVKETVKVNLKKYTTGAGSMDLVGTGIKGFTCSDHSFTKSGQDVSVDLGDCLPTGVTVPKLKYCSDSDTIAVTVKDSAVPLPISTTLKKVACSSTVVV